MHAKVWEMCLVLNPRTQSEQPMNSNSQKRGPSVWFLVSELRYSTLAPTCSVLHFTSQWQKELASRTDLLFLPLPFAIAPNPLHKRMCLQKWHLSSFWVSEYSLQHKRTGSLSSHQLYYITTFYFIQKYQRRGELFRGCLSLWRGMAQLPSRVPMGLQSSRTGHVQDQPHYWLHRLLLSPWMGLWPQNCVLRNDQTTCGEDRRWQPAQWCPCGRTAWNWQQYMGLGR